MYGLLSCLGTNAIVNDLDAPPEEDGVPLEAQPASATTEFDASSPMMKQTRSTKPAALPPAPAAATKMSTCVGVSAPIPWIMPIPKAVRGA